jgi:DNA-binding CsgD family transcriptional regulator
MITVRSPRYLLADLLAIHYGHSTDALLSSGKCVPHPLMKGWLTIEELSVGDEQYVLLRRMKGHRARRDSIDALSPREREALHHACAGASNKEIAYEMAIDPSTVGVLLWRAARRLAAAGREELLRRAIARSSRDPPNPSGRRK